MNEWVEQWGRDCNQNGIPDECDLKPANAEFVRTELFAPGALLRGLALADLDGDGLVDVIAEGMGFSIYFNKGGGVLEPPVSRLVPGAFPGTLRTSDFDGDGDVDLVIANAAPEGRCTGPRGDRVSMFENRGARTFAEPVEFETGAEPQAIEAVDLDGDGDTDLATADHGTGVERRGGVSLLKNRGGGVFDPPEHLDAGISPAGIAVADIDGDGALDIVAVYNNSSEYLNVFRGQGGSEFGFPEVLAVAPHLNWILAGDMDRDGDVDLIVNDSSQPPYVPVERLIVLLNEGGGKSWGFLEVETPTATAVPADLDGDGFVENGDRCATCPH